MIASAVKRNPPCIAHAVGKDFGPAFFPVGERIVRRNRIGVSLVHVDAQNFSQQDSCVLAISLRRMAAPFIVGIAAVAHGDIKKSVRADGEAARVVVEIRLVDLEQHPFRGRVHPGAVILQHFEFGHAHRIVPVNRPPFSQRRAVSQVSLPVFLEIPVQREAEQTAFIEALVELRQPAAHIKKRLLRFGAVPGQHGNDAHLVGHQQTTRSVVRRNQRGWGSESFGNQFKADSRFAVRGGRRFGGQSQKATRDEENGGACKKFGFHAADFSGLPSDNKVFARGLQHRAACLHLHLNEKRFSPGERSFAPRSMPIERP